MEYILGTIMILVSLVLIVTVMLQSGQDKKLSGSIAGSASDTFYGKNKGKDKNALLAKITAITAAVMLVVTVVMYVYMAG